MSLPLFPFVVVWFGQIAAPRLLSSPYLRFPTPTWVVGYVLPSLSFVLVILIFIAASGGLPTGPRREVYHHYSVILLLHFFLTLR